MNQFDQEIITTIWLPPSAYEDTRVLPLFVLGNGISVEGQLTEGSKKRASLAAALVALGRADTVIFSSCWARALADHKPPQTEAAAMQAHMEAWLSDFDVECQPKVFLEEESTSTIGNVLKSAPIIESLGFSALRLVTHPSHMKRTTAMLHAAFGQRLEVVPAPVDSSTTRTDEAREFLQMGLFNALGGRRLLGDIEGLGEVAKRYDRVMNLGTAALKRVPKPFLPRKRLENYGF